MNRFVVAGATVVVGLGVIVGGAWGAYAIAGAANAHPASSEVVLTSSPVPSITPSETATPTPSPVVETPTPAPVVAPTPAPKPAPVKQVVPVTQAPAAPIACPAGSTAQGYDGNNNATACIPNICVNGIGGPGQPTNAQCVVFKP